MKYRKFGKQDWDVSVLGFGVTRLPLAGGTPGVIDEDQTIEMIHYSIDHGVNYLDLGIPYDMQWQERIIRILSLALQDGYRQKVRIAAGLPSFLVDSTADFDLYLDSQLKWLKTDKIDYFILGGLDRERWPHIYELNVLGWAEKAKSDSRIGGLGFSFHDDYQNLRNVLNAYDNWVLGQFQYSYMDVDRHPGVGGLKLAADRGLAVVVTEALKGGRLTQSPPESVAQIWENAIPKRYPAEWGLCWVWNNPEVSTVVCDMSDLEQVVENVTLADNVDPDSLTIPEEVLISRVRETYHKLRPVPCTGCRSCMPCPQGIDVPRIFELWNDAVMYGESETPVALYRFENHCIENCNECGICTKTCGRSIEIPERLKEAKRIFE